MKKLFLLLFLAFTLFGCKMNPNKEARIQQLESDIEQALEKMNTLDSRVQTLETANKQLESKLLELEKK